MAEKTEKATPKKLRDARKKGQVAKSQDFPSAFTFIVSISGMLMMSGYIYNLLASYTKSIFNLISTKPDIQSISGGLLVGSIKVIFEASVPLMVIVSLIGVLVNFLIIGPVFSLESMKPDIKKLNPISNLKNLFKLKTAIELLKSILKISIALMLIYSVIYTSLPSIIATCGAPLITTAIVFGEFLKQVVLRVGIFFIAVGIFDLVFQKKNFQKEMKMEKFEIRQEYKDTEGDPHIKGRRRQIAQEIAYQEGPMSVKRSKMVVTNPSHIAVAIEYNVETEPAPRIVTMGQDSVAEQIMKVALDYNIPIMRNIELAHSLYFRGTIGNYIPEDTYDAVAKILKWIAKLEKEKEEKEEEEVSLEIFKK